MQLDQAIDCCIGSVHPRIKGISEDYRGWTSYHWTQPHSLSSLTACTMKVKVKTSRIDPHPELPQVTLLHATKHIQ